MEKLQKHYSERLTKEQQEFCKLLKTTRLRHGLSLRQMGEYFGCDGQNVNKYEKGKRTPRVATLNKLFQNRLISFPELTRLKCAQSRAINSSGSNYLISSCKKTE